ncbi:MAG TPA: tetratricopeptide repeat protein [Pyrinomonadaceae bacterium]|nr:tetratricopeptide repeat protein [Pyrinomonadaceae bacterium]
MTNDLSLRLPTRRTRATTTMTTTRLMTTLLALVSAALIPCAADAPAQRRTTRGRAAAARTTAATPAPSSQKVINVQTEPRAAVWMDNLRRGTTDEAGRLTIKNVPAGRRTLRVRARGFRERTLTLTPAQRGDLEVKLAPTTDEAELLFQQAEDAREGTFKNPDGSRPDAAELYRGALKLRPRFPEARVGLARVLLAEDRFDDALEEIAAARRLRPVYPEASAVEGRVLRELAEYDESVAAYRRAIREGRGFQPEAHTGLAIVLEDQGDYAGAVESFRKAIAQLSDTEPVLYQMIGAAYEKLERWKDAVAAYEKYLELAPEGRLAPAINSIIEQLRQQAAEQQDSTPE